MDKPLFRRLSMDSGGGSDTGGRIDGLLWYKDFGNHAYGDFSMALVQANGLLEDHCQLESAPNYGTFVGVYDGHGGPEVSQFVADNLYRNLTKFADEQNEISESVIRKAFSTTDEDFLSIVKEEWANMPQIASSGTCCLTGIMTKGLLYIANAGDSRAVLGRIHKDTGEMHAIQLSIEHNANNKYARQEIKSLHPNDPEIVVLKHNVWRVKGIIQVTKAIGDAYLKRSEFNKDPLAPKFRVQQGFSKPILSPDPSILLYKMQPDDQFIIFASDGLWEHITNQDAVHIVQTNPRNGVARSLAKAAMQEAAKKREVRYTDLEKIGAGVRRHFHDDITIIVLFMDLNKSSQLNTNVSVRGAGGVTSLPKLPSFTF